MPELSRFYGVKISMKPEGNEKHHTPHFHVYYGEFKAVYSCEGKLLAGRLPPKQSLLVEAWASLHETELKENWYLVNNNGECFKIAPLH